MKKVTIKNLIDFRSKSDRAKKTFVSNLKNDSGSDDKSGGGDYWISCLSTINNIFKRNETNLLNEKIELLIDKINNTEDERIRNQFQRNVNILTNFQNFNFEAIKPTAKLIFERKPKDKSILHIEDFPIEVKPSQVFTFSENGSEEVGSVWFIAKLNGFKKNELAMFADISYRYLDKHFSNDYFVNPIHCTAVDVFNKEIINYEEIRTGRIPILIESTIGEMRKVL